MKTVIKINNLIGTLVIVASDDEVSEKLEKKVTDSLLKSIKSCLENQE